MRNSYPTPSPSPFGSTYSFLQSSNYQNADIDHHPDNNIEAIREPPRPTKSNIHMDTESLDRVRSLAEWEAGQILGKDYFDSKERMIKKIDAITACLALEPQVGGFVQSANPPSTADFGKGVGGESMSLDKLNSIDDYGYSLGNYIAADPADDSNFLARVSVREMSTFPGYLRGIPPPSGLGTGGTGENPGQGGELEEGYEDCGWEEVVVVASRG
ncbi:hypothetical protein B9Z19DRAFT_1066413 [Tuber borchii]|uniref:Uncharacterized protein n=1 Tax=Tuber borchii TaxID=42251 RepID=A0A2T6ZMN1_TUBBO|nr:hypothetical protein B9Z19DRAFT_1066413 [Tuber borchii]